MTTLETLEVTLKMVQERLTKNQKLPTPEEREKDGFFLFMGIKQNLEFAIQDLKPLYQ